MKTTACSVFIATVFAFLPLDFVGAVATQKKGDAWPAEVERALSRAGDNRAELVQALRAAPAEQRRGMAFLVSNMPDADLRSLSADFLLENVALAYRARKEVPWGQQLPEEVFLNDVLPYVNVDESRHPWRKQMYELCLPLVKDCKTPAEAAHLLNKTIFPRLKVRYSTERKKPHQSPRESIELGVASCTGLSILLSDACRSVAVPARLAGTPLWSNKRGNHTWVEVWDKGWHFTGACEPDPNGLDRGWFQGEAAQAQRDSPVHAIYATSFRKTDVSFPLVWAPQRKDVYAENVTDRYAKPRPPAAKIARVMVDVREVGKKERLRLPVTVVDVKDANRVFRGESRGAGADLNDSLTFEVPPGPNYVVRVGNPVRVERAFGTVAGENLLLNVEVPPEKTREPGEKSGLSVDQSQEIAKAAQAYFAADEALRADWKFDGALDKLLADHEMAVRRAVWKAYQAAPIHESLKADFEKKQVRAGKQVSAYTIKKVGKRPENGWPLFIALHGGGGAPKEVNDSQWKVMQIYYRDQPSATGYQYLALRAPDDTWNGFYNDNMLPLVQNLIRQQLVLGDVDPDKVYLMGYSHGGYGAFFIGPRIPDRFAAVHVSAAAPTDGTISAKMLRNTRFTYMVGEADTAYGRRERCEAFNEQIRKLKEQDKDDYPVELELKKGFGHGGLPDRDKIKDMYPFTRNAVPRHVTWDLNDTITTHLFWLSVPKPARGKNVDAIIRGNTIEVSAGNIGELDLGLDSRLVAFDKPVHVARDGKVQVLTLRPRLLTLCESMLQRGDPQLAFTCRVRLEPVKP